MLEAYSPAVQGQPEVLPLLIELGDQAEAAKTIFSNGFLRALATELASQFVMVVPLEAQRGDRRVIKFGYEEPIRSKRRRHAAVRRTARLLESIGWKSHRLDFDRIGVGHSESHHVEIEAPPQIEFVEASLRAVDQETSILVDEDVIGPADRGGERVHLYQANRSRSTIAAIGVRFRAELVGLPLTAPALALLTAAILLVGSARTSEVSKEAGAALLLIGPALLAAFLAGPGEHPMATRLLLGVRGLVVLSGLLSLVAAGALAGQYAAKLDSIWTVTTIASCVVAGVLSVGLLIRPGAPQTRLAGRVCRAIWSFAGPQRR